MNQPTCSLQDLCAAPQSAGMPIDPQALAVLASRYAQGMTSIRGRRVQRLLRREFAGARQVLIVPAAAGAAVLGLSDAGAAFCATDGTGRHASVIRWLHGPAQAIETRYDLLKDSLPALETRAVPAPGLNKLVRVDLAAQDIPPAARALVARVRAALA